MTKVKFYITEGEILAYFPDENFYPKDAGYDGKTKVCYAHLGQHSSCHPDYLKGKKLASPEQYNDLLQELKGQGYNDLIVLNVPISKGDQRKIDIDAGKIWLVYNVNSPDDTLFEGSKSACTKWAKATYPALYPKCIAVAKLIWEKEPA